MSKTAADHYDVRWRATGTLAWSAPQATAPNADIVVEGLERDQQYDFEVRAVSACGAMSVWVPGNYTVPSAPPGTIRLDSLKTEVDAAQADADAANAALAGIASDDVLSASEKSIVIRDNSVILSEHAGIDAQAAAYGITTETTAYDDAVSALSAYLAGLTTPTAWDDVGGNTTIDGPTFRGKFADVYTTRQTLLNAIYAAAKVKADAAQSTATSAATRAAIADTNASTAQSTADHALATASPGIPNPLFLSGTTAWTFSASSGTVATGEFYAESGSAGFPGVGSYLVHAGQAGQSWAIASSPLFAVSPDDQIVVTCGVKDALADVATGAISGWSTNAGAYARVEVQYFDASNTLLSQPEGTPTAGHGGTYAQCESRVAAVAPATAVSACVVIAFRNHNAGYFCASNVRLQSGVRNLGEVADGGGRYGVHAVDDNNLALVDFSQAGHVNKTMQYVADGGGRYGAAEAGADKTAGKSLTVLTDRNLDHIVDSATYVRAVQLSHAAGAMTVDNATFQLGAGTMVPGWHVAAGAGYINASAPAPSIGDQYLLVAASGATAWMESDKKYAVRPGDSVAVGGLAYALPTGSGAGQALIYASFYAADDSYLGSISASTTTAAWTAVQGVGKVPSGTAYMLLQLLAPLAASYAAYNFVWCSVNDVRVAGSGQTVGDLRNLSAISAANYGLNFTGLTLSYTSTSTTATLNASAATLEGGGVSIGYSAASKSVSGSGTQTWYMWYEDAGFAGGSQTLHASTNYYDSIAVPGSIYLGSQAVVFASSGGGTKPPPKTCVDCDAYVLRCEFGMIVPVRAREVIVGDWLVLIDGSFGVVTWSRTTRAECVTVHAATGSLTCSTTAPLGTPDGQVLAPDATGHTVLTRIAGKLGRDTIVRVEPRGERDIQHITCEDSFFLAGDDPAWLVAHHNMKLGNGP